MEDNTNNNDNKKKWIAALLIILFILLIIGVIYYGKRKKDEALAPGQKLSVAASVYPLAFFASEIVDEHGAVTQITPDGEDPHTYNLTSDNEKTLEASNIIIVNGNNLETWEEKAEDLDNNNRTFIIGSAGLADLKIDENEDPHVWLSPKKALSVSEKIYNAIIEKDPARKTEYEENFSRLRQKLVSLDNMYDTTLKTCEKKEFVTSHSAFGYLAKDYGLTAYPLRNYPQDVPNSEWLNETKEAMKDKGIAYVFLEPQGNQQFAEDIAKETSSRIDILHPIEGLTPDEKTKGDNYISLMELNLTALSDGLLCTLAGKL